MTDDPSPLPEDSDPSVTSAADARPAKKRRRWPLVLLVGVVAATGLVAANLDDLRQLVPSGSNAIQTDPQDLYLQQLEARLAELEARAAEAPSSATHDEKLTFEGRVAALEAEAGRLIARDEAMATRIDRLSEYVAELGGSTTESQTQVRELALVSVARYLVGRGRPLGQLADAFDDQFRARDSSAADAMMAWSQAPVSLTNLERRLDELVSGDSPDRVGWWQRFRHKFANLVRVQSEEDADPDALEKAIESIRAGELEAAISSMEKGQPSVDRDRWLNDARTRRAAETALDRLETQILATPAYLPPATSRTDPPLEAPKPPVNAKRPLNGML